ncbi:hypothetical protein GCM10010885_01710 [Alicyclobacillus cellulosilyticus]|uniref:Permease n=1 Tax=Alicyclobacillus cellulosilyticus TaxID=1003997 RepID=A0A917NEY5_9BACL|nr:permease [Alicyclobacillus cellulosilyticus]GGI95694.1 hypothetical protein GCM10010885_01710 [Alicyclobacillus cellulosilyticus]
MDRTLWGLAWATCAGYLCAAVWRPSVAREGLEATVEMFIQAVPWIVVSMFAAGLMMQLIQPQAIVHLLGREAGVWGILAGALLGLCGTGSRWAVYPLAAGLLEAQASPGAIFAFLTTWQLVSLPRLPAEVPFLGPHYTIVRAVTSFAMAVLGGILIELARVA